MIREVVMMVDMMVMMWKSMTGRRRSVTLWEGGRSDGRRRMKVMMTLVVGVMIVHDEGGKILFRETDTRQRQRGYDDAIKE